jgi:hypothetical protein
MPKPAAKPAADATRASTTAAKARAVADRMAGLAAAPATDPEVTAERSARSQRAATERRRNAPATTARTVRAAPMPAETPRPAKLYSARVSHTTTPDQLDALEEVSRQARRVSGQAVPLTSLLRAATQICLDDARLRDRMAKLARTEWR